MSDTPRGRTAGCTILTTGYTTSTGPGVAATVSYVRDGDLRIVIDPGMVASRDRILGPLAAMGVGADDITDVVLSRSRRTRPRRCRGAAAGRHCQPDRPGAADYGPVECASRHHAVLGEAGANPAPTFPKLSTALEQGRPRS